MAVLADRRTSAQDSAHIDHGALADDRADVDDGAHHDDGIVPDLYLIADDRAWFDARTDVLHVQQRHRAVAAVVLYDHIQEIILIFLQHWFDVFPVTEHDIAKLMTVWKIHGRLCPIVDLYRRLLLRVVYEIDDILCIHCSSPVRSFIV